MNLHNLDHGKVVAIIEEGWKNLDPASRERVLEAVDAEGGLMHRWTDNGDGTLTITWAGVELATVPLWRVSKTPAYIDA